MKRTTQAEQAPKEPEQLLSLDGQQVPLFDVDYISWQGGQNRLGLQTSHVWHVHLKNNTSISVYRNDLSQVDQGLLEDLMFDF